MSQKKPSCFRSILTLNFVSPAWRVPCWIMLGIAVGMAGVVAQVSRATSYLSDSPETCINCHVMNAEYESWQKSSHANVTNCNDCHVPHDNPVSKMAFKARDGLYHSYIFTTRQEPQVIRLSKGAIPVVEANCRRCHQNQVDEIHLATPVKTDHRCWDCHREVPHGRVHSLTATPRVNVPDLPSVTSSPKASPSIDGRPVRPNQEESKK